MRTIVKIILGTSLILLPINTLFGQAGDVNGRENNKKALVLRPNSRDNNPVRRDNFKATTLKLKKPDAVNSGKQLAKGHSKIKPNKKAIQQRREARKNRLKVQRRALRR